MKKGMKSKGYAKGGAKMMKAKRGMEAKMSVTEMRRMAKMKGYDLVKKKS